MATLKKYVTVTEYLMGRAKLEDLADDVCFNLNKLIPTVNALLEDFGEYRKVNSGYRRAIDNKAAGGSPKSAHLTGEAIDLEDKDGKLKAFCTEEVLNKYDLYMEHPSATPSWCHLQSRVTRSGARIFLP